MQEENPCLALFTKVKKQHSTWRGKKKEQSIEAFVPTFMYTAHKQRGFWFSQLFLIYRMVTHVSTCCNSRDILQFKIYYKSLGRNLPLISIFFGYGIKMGLLPLWGFNLCAQTFWGRELPLGIRRPSSNDNPL